MCAAILYHCDPLFLIFEMGMWIPAFLKELFLRARCDDTGLQIEASLGKKLAKPRSQQTVQVWWWTSVTPTT
jgi:hypothetical protein